MAADLPPPVVDGPEGLHAGLQLGDASLGEGPGVLAGADGGVLGRQAEGVEAERREHGVALHGAVAHQEVAEGVVADVALVGRAARVGVHAQDVLRRAGVVGVDLVEAARRPSAAATSARPPGRRRPAPFSDSREPDTAPWPPPSFPGAHCGLTNHSDQAGTRGSGQAGLVTWRRRPGGVAQLVERLTGSQEVRGFESLRLHSKSPGGVQAGVDSRRRPGARRTGAGTGNSPRPTPRPSPDRSRAARPMIRRESAIWAARPGFLSR